MDKKRWIYTIFNRPEWICTAGQRLGLCWHVHDVLIVRPKPKSFLSVEQIRSLAEVRAWYCEWVNPIVSTRCRNWPNSNINVSLMWSQVRVIFTVPNQFYLHQKCSMNSASMFIVFLTTRFLLETIKICPKSHMV